MSAALSPWEGKDPYPSAQWGDGETLDPTVADNLAALREAWRDLDKRWRAAGRTPLQLRQVYRPEAYQRHYRSVWEIWAIQAGKDPTAGYRCGEVPHLDPAAVQAALDRSTPAELKALQAEFKRHYVVGATPAGCVSDHALGVALDLGVFGEVEGLVSQARKVGLCRDIPGDHAHFALADRLPPGASCE